MKNHLSKLLVLTITTLSISSCSYRPILDRNDKYNAVGEEQADVDIKICKKVTRAFQEAQMCQLV